MNSLLAARLELAPVGGWGMALPLAAAFVAALVLGFRGGTRHLRPGSRWLLWLLRSVAALMVIMLLLRPTWIGMAVRHERPLLVVLRDVSRSMAIADAAPPGGNASQAPVPRTEAAQRAIDGHRELWHALALKYDLASYWFADQSTPAGRARGDPAVGLDREAAARYAVASLQTPAAATGPSTRLGDELKKLLDVYPRRRIGAVVLLSDGAGNLSQTEPVEAARLLARRGVPVHTVCYGSPEPTGAVRDSVARSIDVRPTMFVGNQTEVVGDFLFHGLKGREVEVQLRADGKVVGREMVTIQDNRSEQRVRMPYKAEAAGSHKLELAALPVDGEAVRENNQIATFVDVFEGGLRVLLLQGSPLVEGRFVFAALRQAGEFDVESIVVGSAIAAPRGLPRTAADWGRYHVIVFLDVPRSFLSAEQLEGLAEAVGQRGVGFLMTGGERAFGAGNYAGTEVARLLPVRIASDDGFLERPVAFRPTAAGLQARILQIERDSAESEKTWASLPTLGWANRLGEPKSTAEVLGAGADGAPLLAVGQYQSGRVAALALGDTWRWQLSGTDDPPGKYFKRFWRQMILHLTGHEAAARGNVWVTTNRQRYNLLDDASRRQTVQVIAGVADRLGHAITDATCSLSVVEPNARIRTLTLPCRGDTYTTTLEVNEPGEYEARLTASREGKTLGEAITRFVVYEPDVELENPLADARTMAEVARISGGKAYKPDEVGAMLEDLAGREISDRVEVEEPLDLWDNRLTLAIFAGALSFEWILRKRLGLV